MREEYINKGLFTKNRDKLKALLPPGSVAIIHSNDELLRNGDQNFPYRQQSDLFYLSGITQEKTVLLLCPDHPDEKMREVIFTIRPEETDEIWTGHKLTKEEVRQFSGIAEVRWLEEFDGAVRDAILSSEVVYLNQNEYVKYSSVISYRDLRFARELRENYPMHEFRRFAPLITSLRLVKEPEEMELIRKASAITNKAFHRVLSFLKPGMKEYEVEAEITHEFIRLGSSGHAYPPIVASGKNGLTLHYIKNNAICQDGDLLLMDFGAEYGHYAADCSRTIPVNGKFTARQRECYEAVLKVFKEGKALFRPGATIQEINKKVSGMMEEEMMSLGLFTAADRDKQDPGNPLHRKYLMHGVTHFLGLDVHDVGSRFEPFRNGMVMTFEPGLYIREEGIGIRIENDILIQDGPVDLMESIPVEADEIESLMAK